MPCDNLRLVTQYCILIDQQLPFSARSLLVRSLGVLIITRHFQLPAKCSCSSVVRNVSGKMHFPRKRYIVPSVKYRLSALRFNFKFPLCNVPLSCPLSATLLPFPFCFPTKIADNFTVHNNSELQLHTNDNLIEVIDPENAIPSELVPATSTSFLGRLFNNADTKREGCVSDQPPLPTNAAAFTEHLFPMMCNLVGDASGPLAMLSCSPFWQRLLAGVNRTNVQAFCRICRDSFCPDFLEIFCDMNAYTYRLTRQRTCSTLSDVDGFCRPSMKALRSSPIAGRSRQTPGKLLTTSFILNTISGITKQSYVSLLWVQRANSTTPTMTEARTCYLC